MTICRAVSGQNIEGAITLLHVHSKLRLWFAEAEKKKNKKKKEQTQKAI